VERILLHPDSELAAVCDLVPELARSTGERLDVPSFISVEEMLHAVRPDAVVVATPPRSHAPLTQAAAALGCHVFVEKPMASTLEACDAMIAAYESAGRVLMVGHKKRFCTAFRRLKELLDGELGRPGLFIYRYPHPYVSEKDWFWDEEDGGGPLLENAVHAADLLNWLFGPTASLSVEASGFLFPHRAPQWNCASMALRMESGCIGTLTAGMVSVPGMQFEDLYVAAEGGVAQVYGDFDNPESLRFCQRGSVAEVQEEAFTGDPFLAELHHFLACIRDASRPLTGGPEARAAVELALRWKSAARGNL
jgi:predicted dehydrogenase